MGFNPQLTPIFKKYIDKMDRITLKKKCFTTIQNFLICRQSANCGQRLLLSSYYSHNKYLNNKHERMHQAPTWTIQIIMANGFTFLLVLNNV